jgi:hypothetical protein
MAARAWPKPSPRQLEDSAAVGFLPVLLIRLGGSLMNEWIDHPSLGAQEGVFMPLGSLGACSTLPCTRSSLGEKGTWFP